MCVKENVSHISLTTRLLFSSFLPVCKFLFWVHSRVKNISLFSERRKCRFSWIIECDFMTLCFPGSFHQVDAWKICLGSAQYASCQEMWGQMCIVPVLLNSKLDLALVCGSWLRPTDHQPDGQSARKVKRSGKVFWDRCDLVCPTATAYFFLLARFDWLDGEHCSYCSIFIIIIWKNGTSEVCRLED